MDQQPEWVPKLSLLYEVQSQFGLKQSFQILSTISPPLASWLKDLQQLVEWSRISADDKLWRNLVKLQFFLCSHPLLANAAALLDISTEVDPPADHFMTHLRWDAAFVDAVCVAGFFPMATHLSFHHTKRPVMLVKLHHERCVIAGVGLEDLHVARSARKRFKQFSISINRDFTGVVQGIQAQHSNCWIYPEYQAVLHQLHLATLAREHSSAQGSAFRTNLISIEVYAGDQLVAGEIGFANGAVYTSMTGFFNHDFDGSGTAQLCALGLLLRRHGFHLWDFGMPYPYKLALGAKLYPQSVFLSMRKAASQIETSLPTIQIPVPMISLL